MMTQSRYSEEKEQGTVLSDKASDKSPWNVVKNQPETKAGAATALVEGIVRESLELGQNGIITHLGELQQS